MGKYEMDLSNEKKPSFKVLLPEGNRRFKIVGIEEKQSKAGNDMLIITAQDSETLYDDTWFAILAPGKRWFLKMLLSAVGCKAAEDGIYSFDIDDIIGKDVMGLVVHEDNEWINREGVTIYGKQHKVTDIKEADPEEIKEQTDEEKEWDANL